MSEKKRFLLRLDPRLYAALETWAADEFRSVNAQIEQLLMDAVKKAGRGWDRRPHQTAPPTDESRDD